MGPVRLEPFTAADFDQLISWINTPQLMQEWAGGLFRFPLNYNNLHWYIEETNEPKKSTAFVFKVLLDSTGESIGHASIGNISFTNESGRITRIFVATEHQGKGYCKHIIRELLKYGFEVLDLHRLELGVYTHKTAAINCYKSAGMMVEGTMRDILKTEVGFWSMTEMSMLRNEWK